jgi:acyl carrier protein
MREVFDEMRRMDPPLKGIIHAAGTSTPRPLRDLDVTALDEALAAKTTGAWILHELSRDIPIEFFVCYSSIAAVWGSTGLAHYAAANHFLDGLAHYRHATGLPAMSINWGRLWLRGMVSVDGEQWLEATGVHALSEADAAGAFERLLVSGFTQAAVARIDWTTFKALYEARGPKPFLELVSSLGDSAARAPEAGILKDELDLVDPTARLGVVESALGQWVARVMGLPLEAVSGGIPLSRLGLDSLMALELRNRVQAEAGVTLPLITFVEGPSVAKLASIVLARLEEALAVEVAEVIGRPAGAEASPEQVLDQVDQLSDESVDALLRQMLSDKTH